MANTLNLRRNGVVRFIDWSDLHGEGTACRNGLRAAKAAIAPSKDKLLVAMPKPRERIQPLMPKLAKRNTKPERNNIESNAS